MSDIDRYHDHPIFTMQSTPRGLSGSPLPFLDLPSFEDPPMSTDNSLSLCTNYIDDKSTNMLGLFVDYSSSAGSIIDLSDCEDILMAYYEDEERSNDYDDHNDTPELSPTSYSNDISLPMEVEDSAMHLIQALSATIQPPNSPHTLPGISEILAAEEPRWDHVQLPPIWKIERTPIIHPICASSPSRQEKRPAHRLIRKYAPIIPLASQNDHPLGNPTSRISHYNDTPLRSHPFKLPLHHSLRTHLTCVRTIQPSTDDVTSIIQCTVDCGRCDDTIWVAKVFRRSHEDSLSVPSSSNGLNLMELELIAYKRISEARRISAARNGLDFVLELQAVFSNDHHLFMVMPCMQMDLRDYLAYHRSPLPAERRRIIAQITLGIAALHSVGILHRDIKPENIFLDSYFNVRIGDFGLSLATPTLRKLGDGEFVATGRAGTWPYEAPQVVVDDDEYHYGIEADYWSLGIVVFEMESHEYSDYLPFEDPDVYAQWGLGTFRRDIYAIERFLQPYKLSMLARDLLCGLTEPVPERRFGIQELLVHRYFLRYDGTSEFDHVFEDVAAQSAQSPHDHEIAPSHPEEQTPSHYSFPPCLIRHDFSWVNPNGAFSDRTQIDAHIDTMPGLA